MSVGITDRFGQVWTWAGGTLYTHDCLAMPVTLLLDGRIELPRPGLAEDNPNYAGLCAICRHETPPITTSPAGIDN